MYMIRVRRRMVKSRIREKYDTNYYVVEVVLGKVLFRRQLNPIYSIDEYLDKLKDEYAIDEVVFE